jgi:hypothetical protein
VKTTYGRVWPVFSGERGEYELLRGDRQSAAGRLRDAASTAGETLMPPEQVWDDRPPVPREKPCTGTASASPPAWTHAQYVRLAWSVERGTPVERGRRGAFDRRRGTLPAPLTSPVVRTRSRSGSGAAVPATPNRKTHLPSPTGPARPGIAAAQTERSPLLPGNRTGLGSLEAFGGLGCRGNACWISSRRSATWPCPA